MDKRVAQNAINYFLSDKFSFQGTDFLPLAEIIRELQTVIGDGAEENPPSGHNQDSSQ